MSVRAYIYSCSQATDARPRAGSWVAPANARSEQLFGPKVLSARQRRQSGLLPMVEGATEDCPPSQGRARVVLQGPTREVHAL